MTSSLGTPVPVNFTPPTASGGVPPLQVTCTRDPGSLFSVGTTTVQCTARDTAAQSTSCIFDVTVIAATPRLSRTKFLAFGDSLTAGEVAQPNFTPSTDGWPNFSLKVVPSAAYPAQLATLLKDRYRAQANAISVVNSGWPGELASEAFSRFEAVVGLLRPEVVMIMHGYNDIAVYGQQGITRGAQAIDTMAKEARFRNARVILMTLPPPRDGGKNSNDPVLVSGFNAWIRSIAAGEGALLVDIHAGLSTDIQRYIGVDGLHPTEEGYQKIADMLFDAIKVNLEVR
jgi:lysophospholipase L1-like esterase